jgi:hypothetical protein
MSNHDQIIISWLGLRRLIGAIGLLHPIILLFGGMFIFNVALQSSMSAYYYTGMRDVFVGLGFVTGFFLLSYRGYDMHDRIVSAIAGVAALLVALFPMAPELHPTAKQISIGNIHLGSAFTFLLALSYFCLVLFPKNGNKMLTMKKKIRNRIYRVAGVTIILSMAFVGLYFAPTPLRDLLKPYDPIYFAELVAFWAFGVAWLVKGQTILSD